MARKKIVAGNWKMNKNFFEGKQLVTDILASGVELADDVQVIIAPPYIHLDMVATQLKGKKNYFLAAQNCHQATSGAFTGEISAEMLKGVGVEYVILGHSERREYNHETDALLAEKVNTVLANNMKVIFCCGEPLQIREAGTHNDHIKAQIENGIFHLTPVEYKNIVIAYEPIWAIGTGLTASDQEAQDMHAFIRSVIAGKFGEDAANDTSILYGGSCKPSNAAGLFACPDVDGGLIGGAALVAQDFNDIIIAR